MKISHWIATLLIIGCTTVAWFLLAAALSTRTEESSTQVRDEVAGVWGPELVQEHPEAWYETPNRPGGRARVMPSRSEGRVILKSEPKRRGLMWHRTYEVDFQCVYTFTNPTRIPQTFYLSFPLPERAAGLQEFRFRLGEGDAEAAVPGENGRVRRAVVIPAGGSVSLDTGYRTRGTDCWRYHFPDNRRISAFRMSVVTDFDEVNFPVGTGSPSERQMDAGGCSLVWDYPDVLEAPAIGMEMPKHLNAGPVAARIAFFAPVSLLFFVTVLLLVGGLRGVVLHPMHVFFIAAGFFAFHLMFAYLVDLIWLGAAFGISTACSVLLVCGYLKAVGGKRLLAIALPAQLAYLVCFSASFFIDGLTGITLSILGVITLALLMKMTARTDWGRFFTKAPASD